MANTDKTFTAYTTERGTLHPGDKITMSLFGRNVVAFVVWTKKVAGGVKFRGKVVEVICPE